LNFPLSMLASFETIFYWVSFSILCTCCGEIPLIPNLFISHFFFYFFFVLTLYPLNNFCLE
jgi:hypothetical protein